MILNKIQVNKIIIYLSFVSQEEIRPTKRKYITGAFSDNDDSDSGPNVCNFKLEERNDGIKLHNFISISGVN